MATDLKAIYGSPTAQAGQDALEAFTKKWGGRYPMIVKSWLNNWPRVIPFFEFPAEIRRVIYTTKAIESLNYSLQDHQKPELVSAR